MNMLVHDIQTTALNASQAKPIKQAKFIAQFAQNKDAIKAAQKLRAYAFGEEYSVHFDHPQGLDVDVYDEHCLHLNVYDTTRGYLIATTRLLTAENSQLTQGFYSEQEFDLSRLLPNLTGRVLEIGRTCVHPDYRSGAAITVLWTALAEYLLAENFAYLIGCASISLDETVSFKSIMQRFEEEHFVDKSLRVLPKKTVPVNRFDKITSDEKVQLPPLLKAYLRMNAKLGGEAYYDEVFSCADIFVVLDVATLTERYAQRFLKTA
ncbi:MAG: GNAT family N-acyltransferase [Agitococcus sp.]